eukprot:scaffold1062_cov130-Cylindrotheca_fusiformis.AAC.4
MNEIKGGSGSSRSTWCGELSMSSTRSIFEASDGQYATVGIFLVYGSWNIKVSRYPEQVIKQMLEFFLPLSPRSDTKYSTGKIQANSEDGNMEDCLDDAFPCPPAQLPCLLAIFHRKSMTAPIYQYLDTLESRRIETYLHALNPLPNPTLRIQDEDRAQFKQLLLFYGMEPSIEHISEDDVNNPNRGTRLFVAGDRMSVGKTSVCLGILGNLVAQGYPCETLAYIKPATQNESPQVVQRYCERMGISCVSVGPIVYYRGFTRAFLAGETESSSNLLAKVGIAVDNLARGKYVVVVDGVGFPAVGSICGTDNASVARASGYLDATTQVRIPAAAVLVGGSGVGSAVDAYNLNATYFEQAKVPVLGALFNKLSLEGFYSLENCKKQITSYFEQSTHQINMNRKTFGFVPLHSGIASSNPMKHVDDYIQKFGQHVDVAAIIDAATAAKEEPQGMDLSNVSPNGAQSAFKRQKVGEGTARPLSREEIENAAIGRGAAPSA